MMAAPGGVRTGGRPGQRGGYRGAAMNGMPMNQGGRQHRPGFRYGPRSGASDEPLTAEMLAQASPEEAKRMIGERIFNLVHELEPQSSRKITGMLLESMDNGELLHLLESPEALQAKVGEALQVLRAAAAAKESAAAGTA